jgi:hypothetical protein
MRAYVHGGSTQRALHQLILQVADPPTIDLTADRRWSLASDAGAGQAAIPSTACNAAALMTFARCLG